MTFLKCKNAFCIILPKSKIVRSESIANTLRSSPRIVSHISKQKDYSGSLWEADWNNSDTRLPTSEFINKEQNLYMFYYDINIIHTEISPMNINLIKCLYLYSPFTSWGMNVVYISYNSKTYLNVISREMDRYIITCIFLVN